MKILALTSAYPEPDDGNVVVTPTVKYFCEKWAQSGNQVIVIHNNSCFPAAFYKIPLSIRNSISSKLGHSFPTESSRKPIVADNNGVRIYRLPMLKIIPYAKYTSKTIREQVKKIIEILDQESFQPDCIISHWVNPQFPIMLELNNRYNAITSLVFHGDCEEKQIKEFDLRNKIKGLDAIGCRNENYANKVKTSLGLDRMPFICYSGVPDEKAEEQLRTIDFIKCNNRHDFIYVGRLVEYKNVDVIIEALHNAYPEKNFCFHIVGDGAQKENLENLVKKYGLEKAVLFHGQLSRDEVFNLMRHSSTFIMVSNNETFGMVYIEAMLAGCLTIASKKGGVDGVIVDGENGFLSEQGNADELKNTLLKIDTLSDEEIIKIKRNSIISAYEYRDSQVAAKYLEDVRVWRST